MKTVQLQPFETLFSWISRSHCRYGIGDIVHSYQALFSASRIRLHPYLPNHIEQLATHSSLNTEQLLNSHTLYPLFKFFQGDLNQRLANALLSPESGMTIAANIPQAHLHNTRQHKYCPLCAKAQRQRLGFAFFDNRLQLPGIVVCGEHGCLLNGYICGDGGIDTHIALPQVTTPDMSASALTVKFSAYCMAMVELLAAPPNVTLQLSVYRDALKQKGFVSANNSIYQQKLLEELQTFYSQLALEEGTEQMLNFTYLSRMLSNQNPMHPLKHLLVSFWLFDGDVMRYLHQPKTNKKAQKKLSKPSPIDYESKALALFHQGLNITQVARQLGKSRTYAKHVAQINNIAYQHHPRAFSDTTRYQVMLQALLGRHPNVIANNIGVGEGFVREFISNTQGLYAWRTQLLSDKKRLAAKKEINLAVAANPDWQRKDIRKYVGSAFCYLFKHHKAELNQLLPPAQRPEYVGYDWAAEDLRLYNAMQTLEAPHRLSLSALGRAIKDREHLRLKLDKLPLTRAQLDAYQQLRETEKHWSNHDI